MAVHDLFSPDLIVTSDDGTDLAMIVEVKADEGDLSGVERGLKEYMLQMRCPLALVATRHTISVYHDEYVSPNEDSVRLVGRYPAPAAFALAGTEESLEAAVRGWLENIPADTGLRAVSGELRRAVLSYIRPALMEGSLRAAGPRH